VLEDEVAAHALADEVARAKLARLMTVEEHVPSGSGQEPSEEVEQRRFSDAIFARENQRAARGHDQARFDEDPELSIAKRRALELET
jgi:hypothetical protein